MQFPESIYLWLVQQGVLRNEGQIDRQHVVHLPHLQSLHFMNGFLVAQLLSKLLSKGSSRVPVSLITVKSDNSKSTKLTNWNFIWLTLSEVGLSLDVRIKELILQGEQALIVDVVKQLYEHYPPLEANSITIKNKFRGNIKAFSFDVKKVNFCKDPEQSQSTLEFLILLLRGALGMKLEQILGLFTDQNKHLAHLFVKGMNDSYEPIILFYSLVKKHFGKLMILLESNKGDAESGLLALKSGLVSKNQRVVMLTLELFGMIDNLFEWFVSQGSKCITTLLMGLRRHKSLKQEYWKVLLNFTKCREVEFFSVYYDASFQDPLQLIDISSILVGLISLNPILCEQLVRNGIIRSWFQTALALPQQHTQSQLRSINLIGELLLHIPKSIDSEWMIVFERNWFERTLSQFVLLINQILVVLTRLAEQRSPWARSVYQIITEVVDQIGPGDKRDHLVEVFLPIMRLFPSIPSELFISNIKEDQLSASQLLLICWSIQDNSHLDSLIEIGNFIKQLFIENPLLNGYTAPLLNEVIDSTLAQPDGVTFFSTLMEETLYGYAVTFLKYKPTSKVKGNLYFGRKGIGEEIKQEDHLDCLIGDRWRANYLGLAQHLIHKADSRQQIRQICKRKLIKVNNYIKFHNNKLSSKQLSKLLWEQFKIKIDQQLEASIKKQDKQSLQEVDFIEKLKAVTTQERRYKQEMQAALRDKKYLDFKRKRVSKELQINNLVRGQVREAQIHSFGSLESKIRPTQLGLVHLQQLQERDLMSVNCSFKKYEKVLRQLFHKYSGTRHVSHNLSELLEDAKKRKDTLRVSELTQMLKDYGKYYLTSHCQLVGMVRDINIKLMNRRITQQLNFQGFQLYILQFCIHNMIIPHQITPNSPLSSNQSTLQQRFQGQPIPIILHQFFKELKRTFISKGERIDVFEDLDDQQLTKEQTWEVHRLQEELQANHHFILPAGFKKITITEIQLQHACSPDIITIPVAFQAAVEVLDEIFARDPFNFHFLQAIAQKRTQEKVKVLSLSSPLKQKERAMSTMIPRSKSPLLGSKAPLLSKSILFAQRTIAATDRGIAQEVGYTLEDIVGKVVHLLSPLEKIRIAKPVEKKRALSSLRMQDLQENRLKYSNKKQQQKEQKRKQQQQKEKQEERLRRQHIAKFLEQQKLKIIKKKQRQQEEKQQRSQEEDEKLTHNKRRLQQFKSFQQQQRQKIKGIQEGVQGRRRQQQQQQTRKQQKDLRLHRQLKQRIVDSDRLRVEARKEIESKLNELLLSEPIKQTFKNYTPHLKGLFNFLIAQTSTSLTQKNNNNQVPYDTWRYFMHAFELSPVIVEPKDVVYIFKCLTRLKPSSKQYQVGLTFKQFQQALLRLAIKYKGVFNHIGNRISAPFLKSEGSENEFNVDKEHNEPHKQILNFESEDNEFQAEEVRMSELIRQNKEGQTDLNEYGDFSKINEKTLKGIIHYLKVPRSKRGQEGRFREILTLKQPNYSVNSERLKEKLFDNFSLTEQPNLMRGSALENSSRKGTLVPPNNQ